MLSNVFTRIVSGGKHESLLRIKMVPNYAFKFSENYNYLEIPVESVITNSSSLTEVIPAASINPAKFHGYSYLILPNPALGPACIQLLHGGEGVLTPSYTVANSLVTVQGLLDLTQKVGDTTSSSQATNTKKRGPISQVSSLPEESRWAVRIYIIQ